MYICTYTYIYIYICVYVHVYICIYISTYMYTYIYMYVYMCIYIWSRSREEGLCGSEEHAVVRISYGDFLAPYRSVLKMFKILFGFELRRVAGGGTIRFCNAGGTHPEQPCTDLGSMVILRKKFKRQPMVGFQTTWRTFRFQEHTWAEGLGRREEFRELVVVPPSD